jgi:hypothetical protein
LTISGAGKIKNFSAAGIDNSGDAPWAFDSKSGTAAPSASTIKNIIIGEGITYLGNSLAWGITNLDSISLPSTLDSIGVRVFSGHKLTLDTIIVPDNVQSIGEYAFEGVEGSSVKVIVLPASLDTAGVHAFDIAGIEAIYSYAKTPPAIDESTFDGVDKKTAVLYVPYGTSDDYEAADWWKDFTNVEELSGEEIPVVELPYKTETNVFSDDILPFLTGSSADHESDGVVAVAFTVEKAGKLEVTSAAGYSLYLFDDESVSGDEIIKGGNILVKEDLPAGTYYLVVDDFSATDVDLDQDPDPVYDLEIIFTPTGINSAGKVVKSVIYYDLLGRKTLNATGIIIKQTAYDDGSVETKKIYIRK